MPATWPEVSYGDWADTCDTLHAHAQVLGKLAVALAPPEPELQHAALRLTARGWETAPLPAPDGSGAFVVLLDLRVHQAVVESSGGAVGRVSLLPDRSVGAVTRELLGAVQDMVGPVRVNLKPQEVAWSTPLDTDEQHATYDPDQVAAYFAAATQAALVLAAFRAAYRGRSTPVNAWWGSFDLAVNLFSGQPADPPSSDFIMRNAMDAQEVAMGWWPGDGRVSQGRLLCLRPPCAARVRRGHAVTRGGPLGRNSRRVHPRLEARSAGARSPGQPPWSSLIRRSSMRAQRATWDPALAASAEGNPPPIR